MRKFVLDTLNMVFMPKEFASQLVVAITLQTTMVRISSILLCKYVQNDLLTFHHRPMQLTSKQIWYIFKAIAASVSTHSRLIRQLHSQQRMAKSQDEWMDLAEQIDNIQGLDIWRTEKNCLLYESDRIQARIDELVHLMRRRDIFDLMFTLRGGIGRNHFGLLHEGLFSRAMAGSKLLIETYHNVVCAALDFVCDAPVAPNDDPIPK